MTLMALSPDPVSLGHLETCFVFLRGMHPKNGKAKLYLQTLEVNHWALLLRTRQRGKETLSGV